MSVQEVIDELKNFPPDMEARVMGGNDCDIECEIYTITQQSEWTGPKTAERQFVLIR